MSPLWRKRLRIYLGTDSIVLTLLGRGLNPRQLATHSEAIESSMLVPPWQALTEKLSQLLSQPEWHAAEAEIVLSNRLVRLALVPANAVLKKYAEQEALARYFLSKTYGEVANQWELRLHLQGEGAPWLVSAVERTLLDSLRQVLAAQKIKLCSVTPLLMQVYNQYGQALQNSPVWMVIYEPGYCQFALLDQHRINSVSAVNQARLEELPMLLDRENLVSALPEPCKVVYFCSDVGEALPALPAGGYEVTRLSENEEKERFQIADELQRLLSRQDTLLKVRLDFQLAGEQPNRRAGWMLLAAGVVLTLEMGVSYDRLHRDRAEIYREVQASKIRLEDPAIRGMNLSEKDVETARQIFSRLSAPWDAFFTGLESIKNKNVAVLSISPDVQTGVLRVEGEAKNYAAVLTLVAQLRVTKPFSEVFLVSHDIKRDDPQQPTGFVVSMRWANPS